MATTRIVFAADHILDIEDQTIQQVHDALAKAVEQRCYVSFPTATGRD